MCHSTRRAFAFAVAPGLARGFSVVTAVFLVVVLALLGAFIVSVTGLQSSSSQLTAQAWPPTLPTTKSSPPPSQRR